MTQAAGIIIHIGVDVTGDGAVLKIVFDPDDEASIRASGLFHLGKV